MQTKLLLSIEDAAEQLSIGRTYLYGLIQKGEIRSVKLGKSRRIPVEEVQAYVDRISAEQASAPVSVR